MNATIKCLNLSAKVLLIVMSAVTCVAQTHQTPNQPGPPPQVKQTVESRHWILGGLYDHVLARDKTGAIPLGMTCRVVALGSGAACSMKGTASIGPIEEACVLAYDPEGKAVHFMCVTSIR